MPYATIDDVFIKFKPIATVIGAGSGQVSSADVSSNYIAQADSFIDAYLAARYTVPVSPTPMLLTQLSSDLSIFNIMAEKSGNIPEWMDKRYERCLKTLEMLRDGEMILSSASVVESGGDNFAWSSGMGYHGIFSPVINDLDQAPDSDRTRVDLDERADDPGVDGCP